MRGFKPDSCPDSVVDEQFSLEDGPIDLIFGADENYVQIVNPAEHLSSKERVYVPKQYGCIAVNIGVFKPHHEQGFVHLPNYETTTIGRNWNTPLLNLTRDASRRHAAIHRLGNAIRVVDLGSTNGTYRGDHLRSQEKVREITTTFSSKSVASANHPDRNDDTILANSSLQLGGVFDGVGGLSGSSVASGIAAKTVEKRMASVTGIVPRTLGLRSMRDAFEAAHRAVLAENPDIATTAAAVKLFRDEKDQVYAVIATAGDSRVHVIRGKEIITTIDHTYSSDLSHFEQSVLQNTLSRTTDLTKLAPHELEAFRNRGQIHSYLGYHDHTSTITISDYDVKPGDTFFITTDGVHDNLVTEEIVRISQHVPIEDCADALVSAALASSRIPKKVHARAKVDDTSAVAIKVLDV